MEFVRLGPRYSTSYQPDALIEGYSSLIWHERYQTPGEFELKTVDVDRVSRLLLEDTLVSHLETQEVMIVESQSIEPNESGVNELTVKGRSLDAFLNHRFVEAPYQKKRTMRRQYTGTAAACVLIYNAVDNGSGKDLTRGEPNDGLVGGAAGDGNGNTSETNDFPWTERDRILNVSVTEKVATEGDLRWWQLNEGNLYPQLLKILVAQDLGFRVLRPMPDTTATVITVASGLATRGTVTRTLTPNLTTMQFNVYQGVDKRRTVQFSLRQGHLENPRYLNSSQDYKTVVEMKSTVAITDVSRPGEGGLSGLQRRVTEFDAGVPDIPDAPEKPDELRKDATKAEKEARANAMDAWLVNVAKWKNKRNQIIADFRAENIADAQRALKVRRRVSMFSGDISELSPKKYKVDYNLGDTVMLYGDYGRSVAMVVDEYIRTEDARGDRGFPGLVEP